MGVRPPKIGDVVQYRSKTGKYTMPAIVSATKETLYKGGVDAGRVPPITSDMNVHLTVFTPGDEHPNGSYQEFDIPHFYSAGNEEQPGTWHWDPKLY